MEGSLDRVRKVLEGEMPDRAPLYDLLRNDAVLGHFAGERLTVENAEEVVFRAYAPAVDATRPWVRTPGRERVETLADGREQRHYRWTTWTAHRRFASPEAYEGEKRKELAEFDPAWSESRQRELEASLAKMAETRRRLGEVFFFPGAPGVSLMGLYTETGLEDFCLYLAYFPGLIAELLERDAVRAVAWIEHLPPDHGIEAVFAGDDIAYNSGSLLSPTWFREHYFRRFARVLEAYHKRGIRVLFHSDGNLNPILDELVEAGIDGLNPLEVLAGMDVGEVHRRHPQLFLAGGIDVSQLLPFGSPQEVKDAVARAIDAAGGRILVGSTTELNDEVPLENYLALREAVFENPY